MRAVFRDWLAIRKDIPRAVYVTLAVLGFVLPLAAWWLTAASGVINPVFLPSPQAVVEAAVQWLHGNLPVDIWISTYRVVAGFLLAALLGLPLGLAIGTFKVSEAFFQPLNDFIRYMPASAFIPLAILWLGIGEAPKIGIIFIGTFFQIVVMVADSVRRIPLALIESAYTLGATRGEVVSLVIWRGSLPQIVEILRVNMGWAWTYLVVAELVAANNGLGYAILEAQRFLETARIFDGILIIGAIGLLFDLLFRWLHRRLFPWA